MTPPKSWIMTASGKHFDIPNPHPEAIDIQDIALSLSRRCRFAGFTKLFYSVAEHCTRMTKLVPQDLKLQALLHDAAEAYIGDIPSPVKWLLPDYMEVESAVQFNIYKKFLIKPNTQNTKIIKRADVILVLTEARDLTCINCNTDLAVLDGIRPMREKISLPMSMEEAKLNYLTLFNRLWRLQRPKRL